MAKTALGNFTNTSKREKLLWRIYTLTDKTSKFVFREIMMLLTALLNLLKLMEKEWSHLSDDH